MDIARGVLDNLMGRDRNLAKNSSHTRDHYSNSDVCKPFLICFCFNTLFPNTIYDEGPCHKRHDTYLKNMFEDDTGRHEHEKQYIKECIAWIERRLQEVEQKTKKNQSTIDNKTSLTTERPRQILDRILSIEKDIEEMMRQAAVFGENGQIDDSARCLEEVERLREHRKEVDLMGDNLLAVVKHQKICEICGAIQTINDTEKRIQMHLEGKIHQGFLRLRTEIETLKIRLEIVQQKIDADREKNKLLAISQGETHSLVAEVKVESEMVPEIKIEPSNGELKEKEDKQQQPNNKPHDKEKENVNDKQKQRVDRDSPKKKKKQHKHKDKDERERSRDKKKKDRSHDRHDRYDRSHSKDRHKVKKDKDKKKKDRDYDRRSRSYDRDHRKHYS